MEDLDRRPGSILKSEKLNDALGNLLVFRGTSKDRLAHDAHISPTTLGRIFDLKDPRNVNVKSFAKVVNFLTEDMWQRIRLFELAGINLPQEMAEGSFLSQINEEITALNLDFVRQHIMEEAILSQVRLWGRILKDNQSLGEQMFDQRRLNRPSRKSSAS